MPCSWRIAAAAFFVVGSSVLTAASAPVKPSPVRESARASVVEVPVQVIGKDGRPIAGLKTSDFELQEDGTPQEIIGFDVVDLNRLAISSESNGVPASARRHFLFLFDFSFASPNEITRSREAALRFVENGMHPSDTAAVATTSAENRLLLRLTFTSARGQILDALRSVGLPNQADRPPDALAFAFSISNDSRLVIQEGGYAPSQAVDAQAAQKIVAAMALKVNDDYTMTRIERHLSDMSALARGLELIEGRKIVIYFSEGFDGRLLSGSIAHEKSLEQTAADNDAMLSGASWTLDVDRRYANSPLQRHLGDTVSMFQRSDCIVYPVDIAGLKLQADGGALGGSGRGEESLFAFAHGTGGEILRNANDLEPALRRISEKTSLTYLLAYQSSSSNSEEGRFHALRVRVGVKGARVSARAGYFERAAFRTLSPLQRMLSAADVITHEKTDGDFPIEVLALPLGSGAARRVPVLVQLPGSALGTDPVAPIPLEFYVYVSDERGRVTDYFTRVVSLDPARESGRTAREGVVFYGECHLRPGTYRIRTLVRNARDGRWGFVSTQLDVPDVAASRMHAAVPLFVSGPAENRLRLKDESVRSNGDPDPFSIGSDSFAPQVSPVIASGSRSQVCLTVLRPAGKTSEAPFQLDLQIVDASGRAFSPSDVRLIGRTSPDANGWIKLLVDFTASQLETGIYSLRVTLRDSADRTLTAVSQATFRVS
ncbi:MAG: VWA domain-containing protein [Acidobacteriota bacterium]|nr:VWA domain-containing protein [Acidobacteriota bacterium]